MTDLNALKQANATRWANAKLTRNFASVASHLVSPNAKGRYQTVSAKTACPGSSSPSFMSGNRLRTGPDRWPKVTPGIRVSTHVPKDERPVPIVEEAAIDALVNCAPYAARNKHWSIAGYSRCWRATMEWDISTAR